LPAIWIDDVRVVRETGAEKERAETTRVVNISALSRANYQP
jgi:hypothetical protein